MTYVGLEDSKYRYDQTSDEMHLFVPCPLETTAKDVEYKVSLGAHLLGRMGVLCPVG
jgi:hypothetical protein